MTVLLSQYENIFLDLSEATLAELENPTFEGPSIANLSSDFDEQIDLDPSSRRQKTLESSYSSDLNSSIIDDSIEGNQLRFHLKQHGKLRPFEQFQRIGNHGYAFNLLRLQRRDKICQELHSFLKTVQTVYPYGVRHSTLEDAINDGITGAGKFSEINFVVLRQAFTMAELTQLPETSSEYETGGMWVRGEIYPYDEKKYKGLRRLHDWERAQWMVPNGGHYQMKDTLKHHIESVFTRWNFCQKSASHQDQISFCVNWYFRQIVAQLVHLHEVFHSDFNQDPMNKHSLRRYVEENVYSLSETMTENLDSCAALYHMETISDSIANDHQQFKEVFQFYNIQRTDLTDHYQICKKIVNHKMFRQEFRVTPYYSEFNSTSEDFVEFTDDFMTQKIKSSPNILFEMTKEDALTYEDSVKWNENSLQIFHQNRRSIDGFFRDKGLVAYVSACNEVAVQVHQDTLKDIEAEFKRNHSTFMPETENGMVKYNSRTAFYGCFPYNFAGREHLIRPGLMIAAWVTGIGDGGEWNRAIVTEVIDCPDTLHSRMTRKKTKNISNGGPSFHTGKLKIHLIDWGYEIESNSSQVFLLPNSETFLLHALAIRCYIGPSAKYGDVKIQQTCDYTKCKLYTKTTENLGSDERHRLV